jgi:hypothetical protein
VYSGTDAGLFALSEKASACVFLLGVRPQCAKDFDGYSMLNRVECAAVVPDHQVAELPLMPVDEVRLRRPFEKSGEQRPSFREGHTYDAFCGLKSTSYAPPAAF